MSATAERLEERAQSLGETLGAVKRQLEQAEESGREAEEELGWVKDTLTRFPVRLFVRPNERMRKTK